MGSLGLNLLRQPVDVPCPRCEYPVWGVWAEVAAQIRVICPCCRVGIRLVDETGSVQVSAIQIQEAFNGLEKTLKRMFS